MNNSNFMEELNKNIRNTCKICKTNYFNDYYYCVGCCNWSLHVVKHKYQSTS